MTSNVNTESSISYYSLTKLDTQKAHSIQIINNCNSFSRIGYKVKLFTSYSKSSKINWNVKTSKNILIKKMIYYPFKYNAIINALLGYIYFKFDSNRIFYTRNHFFAYLASFNKNKIICLELHQTFKKAPTQNKIFLLILRKISKRKNLILIVISNQLKKYLEESGIKKNIHILHDGFDHLIKINKPTNNNKKMLAMYTGSLTQNKGLVNIYKLAKEFQHVKFHIIGDKNKTDRIDIIHKMEKMDNIFFLGYIDHESIGNYLASADILLLLPTEEGAYNDVTSPLKMFEYMNSGVAILATNLASLKEVLCHKKNSILAKDTFDDIVDKFKLMLENKNLRMELSSKAAKDVKNFSWEKRVLKIKKIVDKKLEALKL